MIRMERSFAGWAAKRPSTLCKPYSFATWEPKLPWSVFRVPGLACLHWPKPALLRRCASFPAAVLAAIGLRALGHVDLRQLMLANVERLGPVSSDWGDLARSLRARGASRSGSIDHALERPSSLERVTSRYVSGRGPGRSETKHRRCDAIPAQAISP
jgi:hypothetical protein